MTLLLYGIKYDKILNEIEVKSIEVIKETPKTFRVAKYQEWLDYKSTLSKEYDKHLIFFTPQDALKAYIKRKEKYVENLKYNLDLTQAKLEKARELLK